MRGEHRRLLDWYRRSKRDLPWRGPKDPYRIWVSEIMLQQTRVETVLNYYDRFLARFPDVFALAAADPDEVRAAWSGLGYYRRAGLMLKAAATVVRDHDGRFPETLEGLRALPGFGRYTAGAVASIAYDLPAPAVDGNTARVVARWRGLEGDPSRGETERRIWAEAEALSHIGPAAEVTQALIELGATVCLPRNPSCNRCPLRSGCVALATDRIAEIPAKKKKPKRSSVLLTALAITNGRDRVLLVKQPDNGLFAGLYTPPLLAGHVSGRSVVRRARDELQLELEAPFEEGAFRHVLTHKDLEIVWRRAHHRGRAPSGMLSVPLRQLHTLGIPTVTTRVYEQALPEAMLEGLVLPSRRSAALERERKGR